MPYVPALLPSAGTAKMHWFGTLLAPAAYSTPPFNAIAVNTKPLEDMVVLHPVCHVIAPADVTHINRAMLPSPTPGS